MTRDRERVPGAPPVVGGDRAVAVVTGAARGVGRAVAEALAARGAAVVVADLDGAGAVAVATAIRRSGGRALALGLDSANEADTARLADEAEAAFGPVTAWVHYAGLARPARLPRMAVTDFDAVMALHARGAFLGLREAARRMTAAGTGGAVVNVVAPEGDQLASADRLNEAAATGAIVAMTRAAARDLAGAGIRVNAVAAPVASLVGGIEGVVCAVLDLLSPDAGGVTGQVVSVDGNLDLAS